MKKLFACSRVPLTVSLILITSIIVAVWFAAQANENDQGNQDHSKKSRKPFVLVTRDNAISNAAEMVLEGRRIFRFDTYGDEAFWSDTLRLHQAIAGTNLGGVGPGVSPKAALDLGLKVDSDALPKNL